MYAGLLLGAISLFVLVESWRMPRRLQEWPGYAGPGVVTGMLGLGLLGMALGLLIRAWRHSGAGLAIRMDEVQRYLRDPMTARLALAVVLCVGYLLALGRGIPYPLTTGAYLVVTMLLFRAASWWAILLTSALATAAITLVFNRIFLIPLP